MSAASCARSTCSTRASRPPGARSRRRSCARSRTARSPRSSSSRRRRPAGITDGEFRRTYFHIDFLEQLGGVKTDIPVTIKKPDGTEELAPPVMRVDRQGAPREGHPARRLRVPEAQVSRRRDAEGDDPVADDAALSRRPRRHQPRGTIPSWSRFYDDVAAPTATSCARSTTPAAATCRWTTPTSPTCATTSCARRRARAATTRRAAAPLRRLHQPRGRAEARRHDLARAPVPRQLQEHLGRAGRLRAGRRGAALAR